MFNLDRKTTPKKLANNKLKPLKNKKNKRFQIAVLYNAGILCPIKTINEQNDGPVNRSLSIISKLPPTP